MRTALVAMVATALIGGAGMAEDKEAKDGPAGGYKAQGPTATPDGLVSYAVTSEYQDKPTEILFLLPDKLEKGKRYDVLYILPVNDGPAGPWGSGIVEARKLDIANKYGVICCYPTFARFPWFGDHPTNPRIRQVSYMLDVVVPFVDKTYPTIVAPEGRRLVGFSKSGWGAFMLVLLHPEVFGRAASWDGCLMLNQIGRYETTEIFGTQENFDKYKVPALVDTRARAFAGGAARFAILGYGKFQNDALGMHEKMTKLGIAHAYDVSVKRSHDWQSGWLAGAVEVLMREDMAKPSAATQPATRLAE